MSMWDKFKALPGIRVAGLIILGILVALLAAKASRKVASAKKKDDRFEDLKNSMISGELVEAGKLADSANEDKDAAIEIKRQLNNNLVKMGQANENMDDIAKRFNGKRLRKQSATHATS